MEKIEKIYKIRSAIAKILHEEPCYGHILQQLNFIYYDQSNFSDYLEIQKTFAGVSFNKEYYIHINLDKMMEESKDFQIQVLKHEIGHIIGGHFFRAKEMDIDNMTKHQFWNIATDITINESLHLLHKYGYTAEKMKLPKNQTSEFYYSKITKELVDQNPNQLDEHNFSSEDSEDEIKHQTRKIIKEAVEKTLKSGHPASSIPGEIEEALEILKTSKYNWRKELRISLGSFLGREHKRTRSRFNKRYKYLMGKNIKKIGNIVIIIDTSGSVSSEMLQMFFSEIKKIKSLGYEVLIVECDSKIQRHYEYRPSNKFTIKGRGGTLYQPAIDYAVKLKPSAIVLCGDGGFFDQNLSEPKDMIWVLPKGYDVNTKNKKIYI